MRLQSPVRWCKNYGFCLKWLWLKSSDSGAQFPAHTSLRTSYFLTSLNVRSHKQFSSMLHASDCE